MAKLAKVDKPCENCGVMMENVMPMQMFCNACAMRRNEANRKKSRRRGGKFIRQESSSIPNPNAKYCKGCYYWGGHNESCDTCNYIFIEGHKRPCPPGKGCTVKKKQKRGTEG